MSTRLHIVVSEELLARVDRARGDVPRSAWIRRTIEKRLGVPFDVGQALVDMAADEAVEQALSEAKEPGILEQADPGSVSSSEGVRSAAPAEQLSRPLPHYNEGDALPPAKSQAFPSLSGHVARSSAQVKGDIRPVPKRGEKK